MKSLWAFFVHLRWHYQVLILPAGYLLGGLYAPSISGRSFVLQFLTVHLFLNGGVTAYNSCHDEDEGPIGGLARPPKMAPWMLPASIFVQVLGLALAVTFGASWMFVALWVTTMILSVAYSRRPRPRWKGHPWLAFVAVGIGTGTNTFLMGYLSAGGGEPVGLAACGVASLLLSIYPISQIFQLEADRARGDRTFAMVYGLRGVKTWFVGAYGLGLAIVAMTLPRFGAWFAAVGVAGFAVIFFQLSRLRGEASEYRAVMRLKYFASFSFTLFVTLALLWRA